jgi:hypothetical protein
MDALQNDDRIDVNIETTDLKRYNGSAVVSDMNKEMSRSGRKAKYSLILHPVAISMTTKEGCPKGISDSDCPGQGVRSKCRWYEPESNLCYFIDQRYAGGH